MNMTNLKSNRAFWVEDCCSRSPVVRIVQQRGIRWPDGVRRWNTLQTVECRCGKCGRSLEFMEDKS